MQMCTDANASTSIAHWILIQRCSNSAPRRSSVVEQYMGKKFQPFKPLPKWQYMDYMGWGDQVGEGRCLPWLACIDSFF